MSAHPAPRATRSIRAETAGSSGLARGPNQRGKAGGEVEASIPVMAMAHLHSCSLASRRSTARPSRVHACQLALPVNMIDFMVHAHLVWEALICLGVRA